MTDAQLLDLPATATDAKPLAPRLDRKTFGRYADQGIPRELRCLHLPAGQRLLIDWRACDHADPRLVAALGDEEPPTNESLLAQLYLADPTHGHCRPLSRGDLLDAPWLDPESDVPSSTKPLRDAEGTTFRLTPLDVDRAYVELRWTRLPLGGIEPVVVSLREVVGYLEAYEPARSVTRRALADHADQAAVSTRVLRAELQRVAQSEVVLNRALRDAVLLRTQAGLTLSEIAARCGRVKPGGNSSSGDTSWLSRRIGLMAEAGKPRPTPWVHSDVLALIARQGLGVCPVEVEAA